MATRPPPGRAPPPVTPGMGSGNGSSSAGHTCSGLRQGPAMSRFRSGAPPAERLRRLPSRPGCRRAAALQAEDLLSRPAEPERLAVPLPVARGLQKRPSWKNGRSFKPQVLIVEDTRLAVVPACCPRQDAMELPAAHQTLRRRVRGADKSRDPEHHMLGHHMRDSHRSRNREHAWVVNSQRNF